MDGVRVVSPSDAENTVVWSNVVTQCDITLQLNILITIKNIGGWIDYSSSTNCCFCSGYTRSHLLCTYMYKIEKTTCIPIIVTACSLHMISCYMQTVQNELGQVIYLVW